MRATNSYCLVNCAPTDARPQAHPESIKTISPDFCAIFDEALRAEELGLKLVCGPGYRKALEFLIKDYLICQNAAAAAEISALQLGRCINQYVANERLKTVATRAAWLGNDETHYSRKWEGKELNDLKALVNLVVNWIEMEESTAAILKDMP